MPIRQIERQAAGGFWLSWHLTCLLQRLKSFATLEMEIEGLIDHEVRLIPDE